MGVLHKCREVKRVPWSQVQIIPILMLSRFGKLKGPFIASIVAGLAYYFVPPSLYEPVALTVIKESDKMNIASKIASNVIKKAPSGPETSFGEIWKNQSCVVVFFAALDDLTASSRLLRYPRLNQSLIPMM